MLGADDQPRSAPVPANPTLSGLAEAIQACRACELGAPATQAVFGSGAPHARLMLVGEQPGDREDLQGEPFVGPAAVHVAACRPWLEAELQVVAPEALVCLGATAAQALFGPSVRIGRARGRGQPSELAGPVTVTEHPSSILRARGEDQRRQAMDAFVSDLEQVSQWLDQR